MRIRAAALAAALLCLPLTACGGDDEGDQVTSEPKKQSSAPASQGDSEPEAAPSAERTPDVAAIGDTITLKGQEDGEQLDVTVKKWLDPAKGADEFNTPAEGKRWVAAQIQLTNTGSAVQDDTPSNGVQVADADGQRFDATYGDIAAGPQMPSGLKLPKGDKALGWIVIEVPESSEITTLQYTMNSGFAEQTGQWKVK